MNRTDAAAQAAVLADADRVQLLALILSAPGGLLAVDDFVAPGVDSRRVGGHLRALVAVGLVARHVVDGVVLLEPTHDALARFARLAGAPPAPGVGSTPPAHDVLLARVEEQLTERFRTSFSPETVRAYVRESYEMLASRARVTQHLPVLTARFASERLEALARANGTRAAARPEVLFVCVRNAGRSQIAAAAARAHAGNAVVVRTAGSSPADRIDPIVAQVMHQRGWWQVSEFPKPLTQDVIRASDVVVTMGCGDACPLVPGRRYVDWPIPDPAGQAEQDVTAVVDEIERRVMALLAEITPPRSPQAGPPPPGGSKR